MTRRRTLAWIGPDPLRIDAAHVSLDDDRLTARGTSAVADYALDWNLVTDSGWVTRRLSVRARGDGWRRTLELVHDDDGGWSAQRQDGDDPADVFDLPELKDALDCDLGLCPFTNTMPVLRHGLVAAARAGDHRSVDFVMAWVAVPELTVQVSEQRYATEGPAPNGGALVRFSTPGFAATIDFDEDGLVRDYPELARRIV